MARAFLAVDTALTEAFVKAQETRDVRIIKVRVQGESLVLDSTINRLGSASDDFDSILKVQLSDTDAALVLFCLTDDSAGALSWVMIAWVPDGCRVRDKMLYSSSREDLKRSLGIGYFSSEYAANTASDITWESFQLSLRKEIDVEMFTETERLMKEEKVLSLSESTKTKSTAMGVLPFQFSAEVEQKMQEFKTGSVNWVELTVANETVNIVSARNVTDFSSVQQFINADQASFLTIKVPKAGGEAVTIFVYSCPESTPVRMKMTMSSSKASVLAAISEHGVSIDKNSEIRSVEDIDEVVRVDDDRSGTGSPMPDSSSLAANIAHSKPVRPGRGKAKVAKFQADDN